jgi:hypothetical protein
LRVYYLINCKIFGLFFEEILGGKKTATWEQLREIEIDPPGFGLHCPALLEGFFGSKRWMAARLGELGGKAKSAAKARASRANGRLGGRPKQVATAA